MENNENNEYSEMTVYELKAVQQELISQFNEYKNMVAEIYNEMAKLSEEYNKINLVIEQRNEQ